MENIIYENGYLIESISYHMGEIITVYTSNGCKFTGILALITPIYIKLITYIPLYQNKASPYRHKNYFSSITDIIIPYIICFTYYNT